ncbi:hypothetical protein ACFE04_001471 [Oxalis oulophora]
MSLAALKLQHKNLLQSMLDEEMLDNQFVQIQALQDDNSPNFVSEVITQFCNDAERIISELNRYLASQMVEFKKVDSCVHQLKGSSSSIGAHGVKLACIELRQASDDQNKQGCLQALNTITHEYFLLRYKFQTLVQLEQRIFAIESNQQ